MTIRFNTFRNRMFATIVAGLAMTNVTFAKGGGKGFGGFSGAKSLGVQRIAPAVKNFAPKMVAKSPIMKIGQTKLSSSSLGTMKSSLNASQLSSKPFGQVKTSDLLTKVGKDSPLAAGTLSSQRAQASKSSAAKIGTIQQQKLMGFNDLVNAAAGHPVLAEFKPPPSQAKPGGPLMPDLQNSINGAIAFDPNAKHTLGKRKLDPNANHTLGKNKPDPNANHTLGKRKKDGPGDKGGTTTPGTGGTTTPPGSGGAPGNTAPPNTGNAGGGFGGTAGAILSQIPFGGFGGGSGGNGGYADSATEIPTSFEAPTPIGVSVGQTLSIDLVLEDMRMIDAATLVAGPAYAIRVRNQGAADAGTFRVAILASIDGTLDDNAPRAIVAVPSLAAGESREMALRLPASAMRLVSSSGSQGVFDQLLVIADPDGAVVETDKSNNLAAVTRADLESQVR